MLCEDVADEDAVLVIAERLVAAVSEPFWIHGSPQFLSASVGISRVTAVTTDATGLLKDDEATRGIPVIALTALAMKGDEERIRAAGCDGYIAKPLSYKEFLGTVSSHLENRVGI